MFDKSKIYYVYMWYLKGTGEVFYIGKGKGNRYKSYNHRNDEFRDIVRNNKDKIGVCFYAKNLDEESALGLERYLIYEYHCMGQCAANVHEGGCGGYTGRYDSFERSRKLSESTKARVQGKDNPMYGKTHTKEAREKISRANKGIKKSFTEEHKNNLAIANRERASRMTEEERLNMPIAVMNRGKKKSKEVVDKMMRSLCKYEYVVHFNDSIVYTCLGRTRLYEYCNKEFGISKSIVDRLI